MILSRKFFHFSQIMKHIDINYLIGKRVWIGLFAIALCIIAWALEISGNVYICPYCRVQRTVIGILGGVLLLPFAYHWIVKYISLVIGIFGIVVACNQHFMGWKKISSGKFQFNDNIFIDPFLLSGFALTAIVGMICLILQLPNKNK